MSWNLPQTESLYQLKRRFTFPVFQGVKRPWRRKAQDQLPWVPTTQQFCETRNILGWPGLAANCIPIPVSGYGCCMYFSVPLCSQKWQKDEQLPTKSAHMSSLTCRLNPAGCQPPLQKTPIPGSASAQQWQKPNRISRNIWQQFLLIPAGNCRRQRKSSSYPSPKNHHRNKRSPCPQQVHLPPPYFLSLENNHNTW